MALGDIHRHFSWQAWHKFTSTVFAWHNLTSTVVLRGRRGTHGTGWRAWSGFVACDAAALCVAGVAFGDIHVHFTWQVWHKLPSTIVLRGRRGTHGTAWRAWSGFVAWRRGLLRGRRGIWWHPRSFHVAGVAQTHIHLRFGWQAWHLWHWVARLVRICRPWRRGCLRGRRGTWWHPLSTWQALHKLTSTVVLRGRRGTYGTPSICVARVAQSDIHGRFAWQAWHSWYWVARLVRICRLWRRGTLRGRRGIWWHPRSFHVAGVAQTHIYHRFAWQALHLWHWVARLVRICRLTPRPFAWQAWHLVTSTFISRGRRGANSHPPSFWVAGVALMALGGALGPDLSPVTPWFAWQAWYLVTSTFISRGRRGTCRPWRRGCLRGRRGAVLGMITSHRACRKSLQNLRLRSKECRTLRWSAEVWWTHHRFDSMSRQGHQSLVELEESGATYSHTNLLTNSLPHIHTYIQTDRQTDIYTYMHISLRHTQLFHHVLCLSFFPVPAATFGAHYWKKLICGVIRSFN